MYAFAPIRTRGFVAASLFFLLFIFASTGSLSIPAIATSSSLTPISHPSSLGSSDFASGLFETVLPSLILQILPGDGDELFCHHLESASIPSWECHHSLPDGTLSPFSPPLALTGSAPFNLLMKESHDLFSLPSPTLPLFSPSVEKPPRLLL